MIQIDLKHEDGQASEDWFLPGELLIVTAVWELPKEDCQINLQLLWETEGKGTGNSEAAYQTEWVASTVRGEKVFRWRMPRGPLSCEGVLLKIRWYIDCYVEPLGIKARRPLQLSTTSDFIRLPSGKKNQAIEKAMKLMGLTSSPNESNPTTSNR
jgi:hypothetical protein